MKKSVEGSLKKLFPKGRTLMLACDQGLEHGPKDFNEKNIDPNYIIDIAKRGKYNALIFQKGIAEKYQEEIKKSKVPLIIKLNGKTNLAGGDPISRQICSVDEAIRLGAIAVGYTIFAGSDWESEIFCEFSKIQEEAHAKGLPVIAWVYPRGSAVDGKSGNELMAYACRVGLEVGADVVKIRYEGNKEDLKWAVRCAGRTKVVIAGGAKEEEDKLLAEVQEIFEAGACGMAIGRNIWQAENPLQITNDIKQFF